LHRPLVRWRSFFLFGMLLFSVLANDSTMTSRSIACR
jgi:hypothetical protein